VKWGVVTTFFKKSYLSISTDYSYKFLVHDSKRSEYSPFKHLNLNGMGEREEWDGREGGRAGTLYYFGYVQFVL
jgi:hypothetical protein